MLTYSSQLHLEHSTMPFWLEGLLAMMDTIGIKISFHWPRCLKPSADFGDSQTTEPSTKTRGARWPCWLCSRCCRRRRNRKMLKFQPRRWMHMAKRRPLVTISVLGLIAFISVYSMLSDENYERIGIDMLAEKEKILQDISNDLARTQPMDDRQIFQMDQYERRNRIRMVCETRDQNDSSGFINNLITTNFNLTYCVIPRSDNTFWLQVLRYLHHDYTHSQPQSPFHLDVDQVHSRPFVKTRMQAWRILTEEQKRAILNTRIFLSVQDPYMRLWTTYMHAVVLPEMWDSVGARISQRRPKNTRKKGLVCAHDVTFGEFITYVLDSYEKDFAPYYSMCDPCQLTPHYTVKAESAHRDNGYILEHLKMDWAVKGGNYQDQAVVNAINYTIAASYKKFQGKSRGGCSVNQVTLNLRLWKTFVMEGILPQNATPPNLNDISQSQLVDLVIVANKEAIARGEDMTSQKRAFMSAAYRNLPQNLLESLEEKYKMDFKLFSYDSHPHDIFGGV